MDQKTLSLLLKAGEYALNNLNNKGELPKGNNGPHKHNMTEARNAGHFSVLFAYLYKITGDKRWENSANLAMEKLIRLRPLGGSFWHRTEHHKSSYNGLIGQAWSIESLVYCGKVLEDPTYTEQAINLINQHKFNLKYGLWHEVDLDGSARNIGTTLNQQIWFMAMALRADSKNEKIKEYADMFLNNISKYMLVRKYGLLYTGIRSFSKFKVRRFFQKCVMVHNGRKRTQIDAGYHLFTIVGLAMIYELLPNHPFFSSSLFNKILHYAFSKKYFELIKESKFAYPYNVPGFEMPFVYTVFKDKFNEYTNNTAFDTTRNVFKYQKENYYRISNDGICAINTDDPDTLLARLYEIYRIDDKFWGICDE